ncbi:MAG TPA: hypothetical protein PLI09_22450 [Candidatus Hydrogenedentes bacterium]|nr:hypothetical protein [Candidatus Hydrogenedentota bacterium]
MSDNETNQAAQGGGSAIAGFLCAGLFMVAYALVFLLLLSQMTPASLTFFELGFSLSGPLGGFLLWGAYKETKPNFARGALIFVIVSFMIGGTCWVGLMAPQLFTAK